MTRKKSLPRDPLLNTELTALAQKVWPDARVGGYDSSRYIAPPNLEDLDYLIVDAEDEATAVQATRGALREIARARREKRAKP